MAGWFLTDKGMQILLAGELVTEDELVAGLLDSRYYTETEADALLANKRPLSYKIAEGETLTVDGYEQLSFHERLIVDGTLEVGTNSFVRVTGGPEASVEIDKDTNSYDFGDVRINETKKILLEYQGTPENPIEISVEFTTGGQGFLVKPSRCYVKSGVSTYFMISFTPTTSGLCEDSLLIKYSVSVLRTITLSGTGV